MKRILHNQTQDMLWEAEDANQRGQLISYILGSGLLTEKVFDDYGFPAAIITDNVQDLEYEFNPETGNLNYRKDNKFTLVEGFGYDNILKERLESWGVNGLQRYEAGYDANGNILHKSDVTQREYPFGVYNYGLDAGPHAVTSVTNPTDDYMAKATPQIIEYTAFNKVDNISQTIDFKDGASTFEMQFVYGPENSRKRTKFFIDQVLYKTKYFIGGNYEIEKPQSGPDRNLHYIFGGDGLFAIFVQEGSKNTMYYIHKDYLGSYYCVTSDNGIVIELNNVEQIYSFDPWGRRRNHTDWSYEDVPISFLFDRGFTGHEHLDAFELINMNGRVYDPVLGRMLSPDNFVQASTYSQNYNRYSYAFNNPLKYTDPDGEFAHLIIGAIIGGTMNWISNGANFTWEGLGYFGIGAAAGALSAGIGAGIGGLVSGTGIFSFSVASSLSIGGVFPGMAIGASVGFTNGFISGTGNSLIAGNKLGSALGNGINMGIIQGGTGALIGGITGGIRARGYGGNLWTGNRDVPILTGRLPLSGTQQLAAPELEAHYHSVRPTYSEASIEFGELRSNAISLSELNNRYANAMQTTVGKPYLWGANGPNSFDCSGAACYGIRNASNLNFGDYSANEIFATFSCTTDKIARGNVLFYDFNSDGIMDHITTAISNSQMVHPSSTEMIIQQIPINYINGGIIRALNWFSIFSQ